MKPRKTDIDGLLIIDPSVFEDERGYFFESYNENDFITAGIKNRFVQDNQSKSSYGVIRGLHMQVAPYEQAKLIRVLEGVIIAFVGHFLFSPDVSYDLRICS